MRGLCHQRLKFDGRGNGRIARLHQPVRFSQIAIQRRQLFIGDALSGHSGAHRLKVRGDLPYIPIGHLPHAQSSLGRSGEIAVLRHADDHPFADTSDQAILFELPQSFADGGAMHAKAGGQIGLGRKCLPLLNFASHDPLTQIRRNHAVGWRHLQFFNVHWMRKDSKGERQSL